MKGLMREIKVIFFFARINSYWKKRISKIVDEHDRTTHNLKDKYNLQ